MSEPNTTGAFTTRRPRIGFLGFHADSSRRNPPSQSQLTAAELVAQGFEVSLASDAPQPVRRFANQIRSVHRWRRRVDVVVIDVFSGRSFWSAYSAGLVCRLQRTPYILWLHGGNLPVFRREHERAVAQLVVRSARVVAPSAYLGDAFNDLRPVTVIRNGARTGPVAPRIRTVIQPRILWMRTFEATYQPELAVRAFAEVKAIVPGATLTMAGADHGALESTRALAEELGLRAAISFAGFLNPDSKAQAFEAHDIFLNTTKVDNTPVSVIEAACAGLVVVATDVGGMRALVADGETALLVPDADPRALAAAVSRAVSDHRLAEGLSRAGIERSEQFSWPNVLERWTATLAGAGLPIREADGSEKVVVAPLALGDLPRIAEIHHRAFERSQLSRLGEDALAKYYEWQMLGPHDAVALGAWDDGKLVGFVFGGVFRGAVRGFLRRNALRLAWDVVRRPDLLRGIGFRNRLRDGMRLVVRRSPRRSSGASTPPVSTVPSFGILSIAVDPSSQGSTCASRLLDAATVVARQRGFPRMHLNVDVGNGRAVRFYERHGWTRDVDEAGDWAGGMSYALDP